jgi:hypothetical protein
MNKIADGFFNIQALLTASGEERGPFINVFIQECELMKILCEIIRKYVLLLFTISYNIFKDYNIQIKILFFN